MSTSGDQPTIDVGRLVQELRDRVAQRRAAGAYADDLTAIDLEPSANQPAVRFRPELAYSTKPVVGPLLTLVKRGILRLLVHVFDDLANQASAAVSESRRWSEEVYEAEATARERVQEDVLGLMRRIEGMERSLERLQLAPRLARLERAGRRPVAPVAGEVAAAPSVSEGAPLDYLAFEARFRGSEETIQERQRGYVDLLAGCRRAVDLGCGRGELVELLRGAGVDAYGVEIEPDFVELLRERGIPVEQADAIAHLEALEPGEVDAVVASHVVEHIPPRSLRRLVDIAAELLPDGGLLVLETPNPESLIAGSINFHRDPTHLRPIHPDTLAFICESAGFSHVEVRRLTPFPEPETLPAHAPGGGDLAAHVDRVVDRLNRVLYGFQDYAVIARR